MLPAGHVSVLVCDTRRAEQWRALFVREGIDARVEETDADEAHQGACRVAVPRAQLLAANALVTEVTQGRRRLGGTWLIPVMVMAIGAAIVVAIALLMP